MKKPTTRTRSGTRGTVTREKSPDGYANKKTTTTATGKGGKTTTRTRESLNDNGTIYQSGTVETRGGRKISGLAGGGARSLTVTDKEGKARTIKSNKKPTGGRTTTVTGSGGRKKKIEAPGSVQSKVRAKKKATPRRKKAS